MLNVRAVEASSVVPAPCWLAGHQRIQSLFSAAPSFLAKSRSDHYTRSAFALAVGHLEIVSRRRRRSSGTRTVSPCSASANAASLGNVHRKKREARIRKHLQQVPISPSAYDTAWVSMVPLPGFPDAPRFPQCIEWILQTQQADGSWGMKQSGSSVSKHTLLSTLACVVALRKWKLGKEHVKKGQHFIGRNFSVVMDEQVTGPVGFSLIFPGMLGLAIDMGLEFPVCRTDVDELLHFAAEELERLSTETSLGTKAYIAYVSEGLGNLVNWSELMKFQRKNGSLFNSPSTTAALLIRKYDEKALQFLSSVLGKFGSAVPTVYPVNIYSQLSMVDSLEKIGISQHFSSEIKSILDMTYSLWLQKDEEIMLEFATCSIAFRLLRMNGYGVSQDELSHVAEISTFHNSLQGYLNDIKSLLELYKASKISIFENELILDSIGYWSGSLLMELPFDGVGKLPIFREIEYSLKFPFYTTLERLDHRRNIEFFYARDSQVMKTEYMSSGVNEDILSLAVEDFTLSQSIYQDELVYLDSWVKENRLDKLEFARQKLTYCYLSAAGSITPHEMFDARMAFTKNAVLATVVDDFFDGGGSKEELKDLIVLVEKWDDQYNGELYSQKVKTVFSALYTTVKELGSKASTVQNCDVTEHLVETWLRILRSMMIEAEWRIDQYVPTIEEYTKNAVVSTTLGPIVLSTLYFVGQKLPKWIVKDQEYNELLHLTCTCTRLLNDIQGLERDEGIEGKLNSVSLLMHHSGGSMSAETAKIVIRKSIITTTRDLLRLVLREESVIPKPCKEVFWKICKIPHFFYFETDGYSSPKKMVSAVNALIYEPLKLSS
uniref:Uncharacterized protein n=1 Tax=Avena sativa TaxID=4498 RepID=A0ACD5WXI3_AVESA